MKTRASLDEADALLEDWARLASRNLSDEAATALSQFITGIGQLGGKSLWAANKPSATPTPSRQKKPF